MISEAGERGPFPVFLYVYVDDADSICPGRRRRSVSMEEPLDTPYGDHRAMVRDRWGNLFQIAHPLTTT